MSDIKVTPENLATMFTHARIGIAYMGPNGSFIEVSHYLSKLTGYSKQHLVEENIAKITHPEDQSNDQIPMQALREGLIPSYSVDKRLIHGETGAIIWVSLAVSPRKPSTQSEVFLVVFQDITREREGQAASDLMNQELGDFAYMASHDLQQPLRIIISFGQLLQRRSGAHLDVKELGYLNRMVEGAIAASDLVKDLFMYSHSSRDSEPRRTIDMKALFEGIFAREMCEESDYDIFEEVVCVWGMKSHITSLFTNIISNAIKFRHPTREPRIQISQTRRGDMAVFTITDNGVGITEEFLPYIFIPFKREGLNGQKGAGVGLSIAKRVAENHGGSISCSTILGEGTTFVVRFPVRQEGGRYQQSASLGITS